MRPKCFKCEKDIKAAVRNPEYNDYWEMPSKAIDLCGGYNYGSSLYDAMMDGVTIQVVICDDCLKKNKHLYREIIITIDDTNYLRWIPPNAKQEEIQGP